MHLKSVTNGDDDVKERSFKKTSKTLNRKEMSSKTEKMKYELLDGKP